MSDETPEARPGTFADLSRRMDRMEVRLNMQDTRISDLTTTVARVERNQEHARELNQLRFDSLDTGVKALDGSLKDFMRRIEGMIDGTIETAQMRASRAQVEDYQKWRDLVDSRLDGQDALHAQNAGIMSALSGAKGFVIMLAAVLSPIITIAALIFRGAN